MAIAAHKLNTEPLTYEQYLAEGERNERYDILEGVRVSMPTPTRRHQIVAGNLYTGLRNYERTTGRGKALFAPCDVLVTRIPLRTRQPDVLFITHAQLQRCGSDTNPAAMEAAPELVVEILSPSETANIRDAKIQDYRAIGVKECWVVHLETQTVVVLSLTEQEATTVATYSLGQTLQSVCFPDLTLPLSDIFAP